MQTSAWADALGYLSLPQSAADLVFQVISERSEPGSLIVSTSLPFGEGTKGFADPRLAGPAVDHRQQQRVLGAKRGDQTRGRRRTPQTG